MIKSLMALVSVVFILSAQAKDITSLAITTATLKATLNRKNSCLHYQMPTQFCAWFSPWVGRNLTPVLDHYLPDLVVMVYRNKEDNPWVEINTLLDKPSALIQARIISLVGSGNHALLDAHEQQVIFKEADVIGNPALTILPHEVGEVLLTSTALPMKPYFQSMLDSTLWRGLMPAALPEEAAAVALSVTHHVGAGLIDWGGVYPHEGTVMGNNDAKASMVIAERATDLMTNPLRYGHIYQALATQCGEHCTAAPITENSQETLFQMVYPIEQTECVPLGSEQSYDDSLLNEQGAYVWIVWRHYHGCANGEGKLMGVVPC